MTIGIGIGTGEVYSGVLGSFRKKEFTSIGMPVNIASRLQKLAGAGQILINDRTFAAFSKGIENPDGNVGGLSVDRLPPTRIKGIEKPITVYAISKKDHHNET
jgi:adenylate cyclase